jgi:phosphate transport system permease protein
MNGRSRRLLDRLFTACCGGAVALLAGVLLLFLVPMMGKGLSAVFFRKTVEFERMQLALFSRGDKESLEEELAEVREVRRPVFELLDQFSRGIDTERLGEEAKAAYREYGDELRYRSTPREEFTRLRREAKEIRDLFTDILESTDKQEIAGHMIRLEALRSPTFEGTAMDRIFRAAEDYKVVIEDIDLGRREEYAAELETVKEELRKLFGPLPGEPLPPLAQDRFGATRWDVARRHLDTLLYKTAWQPADGNRVLVEKQIPREEVFAGTELVPLFSMVEDNLDAMLRPRPTFYWQYWIDDSTPGHFFGGVGPEILGTLTLTLLSMVVAVPLGVFTAAWLVEYAGDNIVVRIIRTCISTLAGVPSIVYGLFGLAFFVLIVGQPSILTASLTLSLLALPVIIRASEEAIRAVPQPYKEASLALGAGKFRTFAAVTLPAAGPGILTGVILSLSRAAGETAPILFAGAVALGPVPDYGSGLKWLFQPTRALSYGCYDITVGDRLAMQAPHNQFGMVMTLIGLVLLLNAAAILIRSRMSRKLQGF